MDKDELELSNKKGLYYRLFASLGLVGMICALSVGNLIASLLIILVPLSIIILISIFNNPAVLFYIIFIANYFIIGIARYVDISGISVFMDSLLISELLIIFIHIAFAKTIHWRSALNILSGVTFLWMIYCIIEVINPSGMFEAWVLSRGLIFNGFIITIFASLIIVRFKQVKIIIILYSILTIIAIAKAMMQKYLGFDFAEQRWLNEGGASTHLISTGTRYFSFFTDAGNFGSNMGCAAILFTIMAFYVQNKGLKIYFLIVAAISAYAMMMSGTRGAIIVPLGGLALYTIVSKNFKALIVGGVLLTGIYVFFAFTYIGQSDPMIRRMRTAFNPSEDASFNVRVENKKKLADHLKNKPFGEGLGLSGVENKKTSDRFTTQVPHDSWYVKLWVETGIVGLLLYIAGLVAVVINCAYIIMFKIKSREVKGVLTAMLCGIFGLMLSAYGNAFFGQYPTMIIVFVFLSIILKGQLLDKTVSKQLI
ncbi:MAG: O-antigen ligase family protein [Muribaculaceae bacterium]